MVPSQSGKRPSLEDVFHSTFHTKYSFEEFLNTSTLNETEQFFVNNREVYKASPKLKKLLRFLNSFVFEYADINSDVVHSYRKGKSTYTAVKYHTNSKYFFKTDINNFFYSITRKAVEKVLSENLDSVPVSDIEKYRDHILEMVTINDHLPVGLSTSPSITNTVLFHFDNKLEDYCSSQGIVYTRYSDDIILSCNDQRLLNKAEAKIEEFLKLYTNLNLSINRHKTKYYHFGNKVKLLGMVVLPSGELSVDSSLKKEIEALFHFYTTDKKKFRDLLNKNFNNSVTKVSGRLNYISTIDRNYLDKLRKKYGNFTVDHFFSNPED